MALAEIESRPLQGPASRQRTRVTEVQAQAYPAPGDTLTAAYVFVLDAELEEVLHHG